MHRTIMISVALVLLTGCEQNAAPESANEQATLTEQTASKPTQAGQSNEILVLSWEDLMPEGESERLIELYTQYYAETQKKMFDLMNANRNDANPTGDVQSMIAEGSSLDTMEQIGTYNVVPELNGQRIRLPGYVVPLNFSATAVYKDFLFVPYFGACLHTPPPPPNQIVSIKSSELVEIQNISDPYWVEGVLSTGTFSMDLANSAYELNLTKLEPYE